jgi:ABC-type Co2+ transport system permease subunit
MDIDALFTLQNLIKYALEGIAVSVAAFYLTNKKQSIKEVLMLGLVAAVTFLILDLFAPMVGAGARHGSGFGIGFGMVGGEGEVEGEAAEEVVEEPTM